MRRPPDEPFKLRFPVAQDRTLRRIGIIQVVIYSVCIISFLTFWISGFFISPPSPGGTPWRIKTAADLIGILAGLLFILSFPAAWITMIVEGTVRTRRYGWRAVSDPIEAQRVATREALYDVATGSTRAIPDTNDERLIVIPTRRLRPAAARLELLTDREPARSEP